MSSASNAPYLGPYSVMAPDFSYSPDNSWPLELAGSSRSAGLYQDRGMDKESEAARQETEGAKNGDAKVEYHGLLIAFEGPPSVIATQLRLLPTSSQILVLPDIQQYMSDEESDPQVFDARDYIRRVHEASQKRHGVALDFLRRASPDAKRIVFLCGGTAGAQATCVAAIRENAIYGDPAKADRLFATIVSRGVAGLSRSSSTNTSASSSPQLQAQKPSSNKLGKSAAKNARNGEPDGHLLPIHIPPLSPRPKPARASASRESVAAYSPSPLSDNSPSSQPATPDRVEFGEARVVQMRLPEVQKQAKMLRPVGPQTRPSQVVEPCLNKRSGKHIDVNELINTLNSRAVSQQPGKTAGEPVPKSRHLETTKALLEKASSHNHNSIIPPLKTSPIKMSPPMALKTPPQSPSRLPYIDKGTDAKDLSPPRSTGSGSGSSSDDEPPPFHLVLPLLEDLSVRFVTDGMDRSPGSTTAEGLTMDFVIRRLKKSPYQVRGSPSASSSDADTQPLDPETPTSPMPRTAAGFSDRTAVRIKGSEEALTQPSYLDEYDPFSPNGSYATYQAIPLEKWKGKAVEFPHHAAATSSSSRPSASPRLPAPSSDKFITFYVRRDQAAVAIQDALRKTLESFPALGDKGYDQPPFPLSTHGSNLWRPVFFDQDTNSSQAKHGRGRIDMILAFGAQTATPTQQIARINARLERLAVKPNGVSQAGRLDIRYLIARAYQSFRARSDICPSSEDPLADPALLATLMVPQLETYLASQPNIRFLLLEYPEDQFATVLSLQNLIGDDVFKVAGIVWADEVNGVAGSSKAATGAHQHHPTTSRTLARKTSAAALESLTIQTSSTPPSFSHANFVLTSSATESEISNFVSSVWKLLIKVSEFYVPEFSPHNQQLPHRSAVVSRTSLFPSPPPATAPATTTTNATATASTSYHRQTASSPAPPSPTTALNLSPNLVPAAARLTPSPLVMASPRLPPRPPSPTLSVRSKASATETVRTVRTSKSGKVKFFSKRLGKAPASHGIAGGVEDGDDEEEYDEELGSDEKMLVPMLKRRNVDKANVQKALKWLGIS